MHTVYVYMVMANPTQETSIHCVARHVRRVVQDCVLTSYSTLYMDISLLKLWSFFAAALIQRCTHRSVVEDSRVVVGLPTAAMHTHTHANTHTHTHTHTHAHAHTHKHTH
jgi:hypothetical protein